MKTYRDLVIDHGTGHTKVTVTIIPSDVFTKNSLYRDHRHYVESLFKDKGYEVTRHNHTYSGDAVKDCGLIYCRSDSDLDPRLEVIGIVGKSIKAINAAGD